jgi:methionyl-tRNA formyltransferase
MVYNEYMKKISLAYFGTPVFAAELLKMLLDDTTLPIDIKLIVTQPDRASGRKKIMTPSPVKAIAQQYGIPVWDGGGVQIPNRNQQNFSEGQLSEQSNSELNPQILRVEEGIAGFDMSRNASLTREKFSLIGYIRNENIDLALLFAYGKIIKPDLLEAPRYGFWNIHPSLLPKYRGTSPMTYPLILGDTTSGVSLMKMDSQMDHGPIIAQRQMLINPDDRNPDLQKKAIAIGFELLKEKLVIPNSVRDPIEILKQVQDDMTDQDNTQATYTRPQTKKDGYIPLSILKKALHGEKLQKEEIPEVIQEYYKTNKIIADQQDAAQVIYNLFRGLYPWPGIWTILSNKKRMKITDVELLDNKLGIKKVHIEGKQETTTLPSLD